MGLMVGETKMPTDYAVGVKCDHVIPFKIAKTLQVFGIGMIWSRVIIRRNAPFRVINKACPIKKL